MRRVLAVLALAAGALVVGALGDRGWASARRAIPELRRADLELTAGQGAMLGLLGGFRPILADLTWIRAYVKWERRDRGCEALLRLACLLDPHATVFWEWRGNMVGLDMAHWEIRARGGYDAVPPEEQQRVFERYARKAIEGLEEGVPAARKPSALLLVAGYLAETKLRDPLAAAGYYRRGWETPPCSWYAAVFAARLLREAGKPREAYAFLRPIWVDRLSKMRDGSPLELELLRALEQDLALPPALRIPRQEWEGGEWKDPGTGVR